VADRNETAHPNGNIFLSTQRAFDDKVSETLRVVDEIQDHSTTVIERCYREFLLGNHDPEEREYPDPEDQIREVLVHGNYLSEKDMEICQGVDLSDLADQPGIENIRELHRILDTVYGSTDEFSAS
jgi:hypothetical protein